MLEPMECPYCGVRGLRHVPHLHPESMDLGVKLDLEGMLGVCSPGQGWWQVQCYECQSRGPNVQATKEKGVLKAVEAWNKRVDGRLF